MTSLARVLLHHSWPPSRLSPTGLPSRGHQRGRVCSQQAPAAAGSPGEGDTPPKAASLAAGESEPLAALHAPRAAAAEPSVCPLQPPVRSSAKRFVGRERCRLGTVRASRCAPCAGASARTAPGWHLCRFVGVGSGEAPRFPSQCRGRGVESSSVRLRFGGCSEPTWLQGWRGAGEKPRGPDEAARARTQIRPPFCAILSPVLGPEGRTAQ